MSEDVIKKTKTWADYYPIGNSYRVEARLPSDLYKLFRQYMIDQGHEQVSPALKEIFSTFLNNHYKTSN
tara:strand:+ start:642 stop:848 length:207 start_codon:yes stop_codon:yes gene_type:complete